MTPAQYKQVKSLKADGFVVVAEGNGIVRMTRGADRRVIFPCGQQKRGNHHN